MNKAILFIIVCILLGCIKERHIGQYISTTVPVI